MKAWKKGAILGVIPGVYLFRLTISAALGGHSNYMFKVISYPLWFIIQPLDYPLCNTLWCTQLMQVLWFVYYPLLGVLIGALLGLLYDKIAQKTRQNKKSL